MSSCGGEGNDTLYGQSGNDRLFGLAGNDFLDGQTGNDILAINDVDVDTLWGKRGSDWFLPGLNDLVKDKASFERVN